MLFFFLMVGAAKFIDCTVCNKKKQVHLEPKTIKVFVYIFWYHLA